MKTEFIDVSDTQKNLVVEIPSTVVDAEIDKVARDYSRAARMPGISSRQGAGEGRAPAVPRSDPPRRRARTDSARGGRGAARARRRAGRHARYSRRGGRRGSAAEVHGDLRNRSADRAGDYATITLHHASTAVADAAVDEALNNLRERAARYEPVDGRGIQPGDSVVMDLRSDRHSRSRKTSRWSSLPANRRRRNRAAEPQTDKHEDVTVEIGGTANPPGFDDQLIGLNEGREKTFDVQYPRRLRDRGAGRDDGQLRGHGQGHPQARRPGAGRRVREGPWRVREPGRAARARPRRSRTRSDARGRAGHRGELLKQLASRVTFDVPAALLDREIDRRMEDFVRRLMDQQIDPMKVNINWEEFREKQREPAAEAVRGALALDEVARREHISVSDEEINAEVERYAERSGRGAAAVRAKLEKEGGIARLYSGLRREKTVEFLLAKATKIQAVMRR